MIEASNLSIKIGGRMILKNITFSLSKGTLCILGLNGSGKTTLLKTLVGLNRNYKGQILINQKSLRSYSYKNLAKVISFVPQEHIPFFKYTVYEMVMFGRTPHIGKLGFPTKLDSEIVKKVLSDIGIYHLNERYYSELSGGEKRLVLIAMSLAQETQIILFDEPTTSLDLKNSMIIISKIKKLAHEFNKLIIITMHDINQATAFSDQTLLIYSENNNDIGKTDFIINEQNLKRLYGMEFKLLQNGQFKFIMPLE